MRVICVADSDSRLKWTRALARRLEPIAGVIVANVLVSGSAMLSDRQVEELGLDEHPLVLTVDEMAEHAAAEDAAVVVACLPGGRLVGLRMAAGRTFGEHVRRPVFVTGYAGVVYEKYAEGIMWRSGYDLICVNSTADHEMFDRMLRGARVPTDGLVRTGFAVLDGPQRERSSDHRIDDIGTITFAVQPDVPSVKREREYIIERLTGHARAYPERRVVVKMRARPDEITTHREVHHYEKIVNASVADAPVENLEVVYGPMAEVLDTTDVLLTVSSTAAVEAWARGIDAVIITDFGIAERYGNHHFLGCGALATFDDLDAGIVPRADRDWLEANGIGADTEDIAERVRVLLDAQASLGRALPWPDAFYSPGRTPLVIERLQLPSVISDRRVTLARRAARKMFAGRLGRGMRKVKRWADG
jgi:hypothetical protein